MNPDNEKPSVLVHEGEKIVGYFDDSVTSRISTFFYIKGVYIIIAGIILPYFVSDILSNLSLDHDDNIKPDEVPKSFDLGIADDVGVEGNTKNIKEKGEIKVDQDIELQRLDNINNS